MPKASEKACDLFLKLTLAPKELNSVSCQGEKHKNIAEGQVEEWWNVYRKMCSAQGWLSLEEAGYDLSIDTRSGDSTTPSESPVSPLSAKRRDLIAHAMDHPPPARELAGLIWDIY
ncbi:MAG: hypothetical protein EOP48_24975, partial [Sphingobacteriales bacterium]